jgi:biotin carboxyl carrier protein
MRQLIYINATYRREFIMGKTYRAMHSGTVTQLNVADGEYISAGTVVARTMWTDERGRSLTGGSSAPIKAPINGVVRVFVPLGTQFEQNQPLFSMEG